MSRRESKTCSYDGRREAEKQTAIYYQNFPKKRQLLTAIPRPASKSAITMSCECSFFAGVSRDGSKLTVILDLQFTALNNDEANSGAITAHPPLVITSDLYRQK
ncbi:MAG: hypothetical protein WAK67_20635 [Xanthobacteraceae bacterium]